MTQENLWQRIVQLEEELLLARRYQALGLLATGLSHEVNNSLSAISGYAELIRRKHGEEHADILRFTAGISESTQKVFQQTERLRLLTRKDRPREVMIDLHAQLRELQEVLQVTLGNRFAFHWDLQRGPAFWTGDANFFQGLVLQVILLARGVLPEGGNLTLRTTRKEQHFLLDVISLDQRLDAQILYKAMRGEEAPNLAFMALRKILQKQEGDFFLENLEPSGWQVRIQLPLVAVPVESCPECAKPEVSNTPPNTRAQLWVLDDDDELVELLSHLAKQAELDLYRMSANPQNWFGHPQNILLDRWLGNIDGEIFVEDLQKQYPHAKIAMMSGDLDAELCARLSKKRIACFGKPFDLKALREWLVSRETPQ